MSQASCIGVHWYVWCAGAHSVNVMWAEPRLSRSPMMQCGEQVRPPGNTSGSAHVWVLNNFWFLKILKLFTIVKFSRHLHSILWPHMGSDIRFKKWHWMRLAKLTMTSALLDLRERSVHWGFLIHWNITCNSFLVTAFHLADPAPTLSECLSHSAGLTSIYRMHDFLREFWW